VIDREILAQVRRVQIRTQRAVTDVMAGGYASVFRGAGIEFDEVREFAEGDDLRAVDWNVTARMGRPFVKTFVEERELSILFVLDLSASLRFGAATPVRADGRARRRTVRETAAEFCACLALSAARNNDKAGLVAHTDRIERFVPIQKGSRHALRLVRDALALTPRGRATDLAGALDFAARVQRRRAVVFVVGDFLSGGADDAALGLPLRRLARRHDVVAVRVRDPATTEPSPAGLLRLVDMETGAVRWVDTGSRRVRDAWRRRLAAADAAQDDRFRRAGVDVVDVRTDVGVADPIVRFFRMREMRGRRG